MTKKVLICIALGLCSKLILAQDVNLFVNDIKEERHLDSDKSFVELTALIKGVKVDEFNQVKIKSITSASADDGSTLQKKESFFGDDYSNNNELKIKLEAPTRKAINLINIEGVLKYFSPTEANGGKVIVKNPLNYYNKNLLSKKYKDVKVTLVDKAALDKLKEKDEKEYQKKLKELKESGVIAEGMAETVDAFKQFFEGFGGFDEKNALSFYVEDSKEKIVDIFIYNEEGKKMNYGSSRYGAHKLSISLKEEAQPNWTIEILIESEQALKEHTFKIASVLLP
ncbi:hypothetical protein QYR09_06035 [Cellulophaga lytica]|nr:hypothetical protein QYR09_06035 [Cellulophaga lytica]